MVIMNNVESKAYLSAKLRNLKRKHSKLAQHAELADEYLEIGKEIKFIESELSKLQ